MSDDTSRQEAVRRLRGLADDLNSEADLVVSGGGTRSALDRVAVEIRGVQVDLFGTSPRSRRGEGAKAKILAFMQEHVGETIHGEQIAEISGIHEWARRVRELRVEDGYEITEVGSSAYRLEKADPDPQRAAAWQLENSIRRHDGSGMERISALFEANVGKIVTRKQIDYVSKIGEGVRRVRELRDEHGWPINSNIDEKELRPGEYRLASADPEDRRDPLQRLYPEKLRQEVFERDNYTCRACGRDRAKAEAAGDTRFYLEVHHEVAVADELASLPKSERNKIENLVTLCHSDHLRETAKLQRQKRSSRGKT
jgi:hypothetical protein